jgi:hypothetical protein
MGVLTELLQIKWLHNRCKLMETIIVSWQNGIRFSVKWKLSLHKRFPSKLSWNEYIVSTRYHCNKYHCKIFSKQFLPKRFAIRFYPLQTIVSLQVDRFESISLQVDRFCTISKVFQKHCNTIAKSLLHKRRVEMFLSVSARFSLQICFKQKVATDISE